LVAVSCRMARKTSAERLAHARALRVGRLTLEKRALIGWTLARINRELLRMTLAMSWERRRQIDRVLREKREADETSRAIGRILSRREKRLAVLAPRLDWTGEHGKQEEALKARLVAEFLAKRRR